MPESFGAGNKCLPSEKASSGALRERERRTQRQDSERYVQEQASGDLSGEARKTEAEVYKRILSAELKCSGLIG